MTSPNRCHSASNLVERLLALSSLVAFYASWMIPVVRERTIREVEGHIHDPTFRAMSYLRRGWNFEQTLQRTIAGFIDRLINDEDLHQLFILQWRRNLRKLIDGDRKAQARYKSHGVLPPRLNSLEPRQRERRFRKHLGSKASVLYVGCGTGTECFRYEKMGFDVVGIDTDAELLQVMSDWCYLLKRRAKPVRMDLLHLGLMPREFDAAVVEIFGLLPSRNLRLRAQRSLAQVLRPRGVALMVFNRSRYSQYMQAQNLTKIYGDHPDLGKVLRGLLDFSPFEPEDIQTDQLIYGIGRSTYTCEAVFDELSSCFEILECQREHDARYISAIVRPLPEDEWKIKERAAAVSRADFRTPETMKETMDFLQMLEKLVNSLEKHTNDVRCGHDGTESEDSVWGIVKELLLK